MPKTQTVTITPEEATVFFRIVQGDRTAAELANHLGVTTQSINRARKSGFVSQRLCQEFGLTANGDHYEYALNM